MAGAAAGVGVSQVAAGIITGPGYPRVLLGGADPLSVIGDTVSSHGVGAHAAATMAQGSTRVLAGGRPVCRTGDLATCGDACSTGYLRVIIGG